MPAAVAASKGTSSGLRLRRAKTSAGAEAVGSKTSACALVHGLVLLLALGLVLPLVRGPGPGRETGRPLRQRKGDDPSLRRRDKVAVTKPAPVARGRGPAPARAVRVTATRPRTACRSTKATAGEGTGGLGLVRPSRPEAGEAMGVARTRLGREGPGTIRSRSSTDQTGTRRRKKEAGRLPMHALCHVINLQWQYVTHCATLTGSFDSRWTWLEKAAGKKGVPGEQPRGGPSWSGVFGRYRVLHVFDIR